MTDKTTPIYSSQAEGTTPLMLHVRAPSTLPAGYTFEAEINGDPNKTFTCEVPEGGVEEGTQFLAPLPKDYTGTMLNAPTGRWKDGLFSFFNAGFLHPSIWCAVFCQQILMGQVMTRMQLTWLGEPGPLVSTKNTFKIVVTLLLSYIVYSTALQLADLPYEFLEAPYYTSVLKGIGSMLFTFWSIYSLCRTRQSMRERYSIPEEHCTGCEDLCCSIFCSCCATAQMARHTGEYEVYEGKCFTSTGHPEGTPLVV